MGTRRSKSSCASRRHSVALNVLAAALLLVFPGVLVCRGLYRRDKRLPPPVRDTEAERYVASYFALKGDANASAFVEFPTICILDWKFCSLLPSATLAALRKSSSPQSRAYLWSVRNSFRVNYTNAQRLQRFTLAALYYSTGGTNWSDNTGWLSDSRSECYWAGCRCWENTASLQALAMDGNDLDGTLPRELGMLTSLERLQITMNTNTGFEITGSLPSELGLLSRLTYLDFQILGLSGAIPSELGKLCNLNLLWLAYNDLEGTIPTELSLLHRLTFMGLESNQLSGTLPHQLSNLTRLERLQLHGNALTGSIPSSMRRLRRLSTLSLDSNELTGTIPTVLGRLTSVYDLGLSSNLLTGPIPTEFGRMALNLDLMLSGNFLNGTIPTELGMITYMDPDMSNIYLSDNRLTGSLPSELGRLSNLKTLVVSHNNLSGTLPPELCAQVGRGLELEVDCQSVDCGTCGCRCPALLVE